MAGRVRINEDRLPAQIAEYEDRRRKKRFPIEQEVLYRTLDPQHTTQTGCGKTVNISSSGVYFTTQNGLSIGMPVELSINWPLLLGDSCPMKLMVRGRVIRTREEGAALVVEHYEFRTRGSRGLQQPLQAARAGKVTDGIGDRATN